MVCGGQVIVAERQLDDSDIAFVTEVWGQGSQLSVTLHLTLHEWGILGGTAEGWHCAWGEVNRAGSALEADTSDGNGDTTRDLAKGWVDRGNGIRRTNDLRHIK